MPLVILLVLVSVASAGAQPVADFSAVAAFDGLMAADRITAEGKRVLLVDRSVGANISDGLTCLSGPYATARNSCKRFRHPVAQFSSVPETWAGSWNRSNIAFFAWPGSGMPPELPCGQSANTWGQKLSCFAAYVTANASAYDVVVLMPSYLDAEQPDAYVAAMRDLRAATGLTVGLATSSLARSTAGLSGFNAAVRAAAAAEGFPLLDVADIETRDQTGQAWFDNRDGIPYTTSSCSENHPDDGLDEPAIAPHYTRECDGGHLGNPDVGKIRIAKAIWWWLSRL